MNYHLAQLWDDIKHVAAIALALALLLSLVAVFTSVIWLPVVIIIKALQ